MVALFFILMVLVAMIPLNWYFINSFLGVYKKYKKEIFDPHEDTKARSQFLNAIGGFIGVNMGGFIMLGIIAAVSTLSV